MFRSFKSTAEFGAFARRQRRALHKSQSDVAAAAGVRQATISDLENGKPVNFDTVLAVAAALDIEMRIIGASNSPTVQKDDSWLDRF